MRETRSRTSSGPSRFMGGAAISANRTAPSLRTVSVSKTTVSPRPSSLISSDIFPLSYPSHPRSESFSQRDHELSTTHAEQSESKISGSLHLSAYFRNV